MTKIRQRYPCPPGLASLGLQPRWVTHLVAPDHPDKRHPWWQMEAFGLLWLPRAGGVFTNAHCARHDLVPGSAVLLLPGVRHRYGAQRGFDYEEYSVIFDGPWPRLLLQEGVIDPRRPTFPTSDHARWRRRMRALVACGAAGTWRELPPLLMHILHDLLWREPGPDDPDDPVVAVAEGLRRDPTRDWDLQALAVGIGMPWSTFRQRFTRDIGQPPLRFLLEQRVHLAARLLLEHPQATIADIARRSGYGDINHFGRIFRRAHGMSPGAFRRSTVYQMGRVPQRSPPGAPVSVPAQKTHGERSKPTLLGDL
ncbi:MAG: AraC family transcriptional regulator [Planctomycetota bacterium]